MSVIGTATFTLTRAHRRGATTANTGTYREQTKVVMVGGGTACSPAVRGLLSARCWCRNTVIYRQGAGLEVKADGRAVSVVVIAVRGVGGGLVGSVQGERAQNNACNGKLDRRAASSWSC